MTVARRDTAGTSLLCVRAFPHPGFIFLMFHLTLSRELCSSHQKLWWIHLFLTAQRVPYYISSVKEPSVFIHSSYKREIVNIWYVKALYQAGRQHAQYLYLMKTLLCGYLLLLIIDCSGENWRD